MPNSIERDVYVLRDTLKNPISYVRGTDLLPIMLHFRDFTIPSGATAKVFVAKNDGNAVYGGATITGNDVTVDVTQQMFITLGVNLMQVEIDSGNETLVTFEQPVMVTPNLKAGDLPDSTTDVDFIDKIIEQAQEAVNDANAALETANTAISGANTAAESANSAAQNANNVAEELQDKVDAGDFTASVQVGTTTTLDPDQDATVSNSGTSKDAVLNFGIPKGDPGTAASIQVGTTQTVQPEENAEVTNSGTTTAAVLNFKIPRGEDGMTDLTAEYKDDSSYTCQPTVNAPVVVKELDGKTEQVETTGAQLIPFPYAGKPGVISGINVNVSDDGSVDVNGTTTYGFNFMFTNNLTLYPGTYTCSLNKEGTGNINFYIYDGASVLNNISNTFTVEEVKNVQVYLNAGSAGVTANFKCYPMLNEGFESLPYEPYTGGSPAPSPDYPQVIKGVGGMGYFDGEWRQGNISSTGTVGTETTGITSANTIPCKQSDSIVVTYEESINAIAVAFYNASGAYISTSTSSNNVDTFTATSPANAASFKVNLSVASGSTITPSTAKYCTVTINGEYQTGVEVTGVQLFDASKIPSKTQSGATVTNNGDGSFTISGSGNTTGMYSTSYNYAKKEALKILKEGTVHRNFYGVTVVPRFIFGLRDKTTQTLVSGKTVQNNKQSFEITAEDLQKIESEEYILAAIFYENSGVEIKPGTIKPMIYQDGDGTWEPYHHTAISIPLTSPLYKGDKICYVKPEESYVDADGTTVIADRILYGVYRENATVAFDGSEDEVWAQVREGGNIYYRINLGEFGYVKDNESFCNKFISSVINSTSANIGFDVFNSKNMNVSVFVVRPGIEEVTDLTTFKTWLQSNPLTVLYKLATPYFEPFTDQSIFYTLRTDDTLSYVYSSDPIEPILTVEVAKNGTGGYLLESYAQAQKNAIAEANSQSRLSAIEQQLVNQATTPTE